jgi:hypothetical protein
LIKTLSSIARHVWEEYIEQAEEIRHTIGSKEIYAKKETIERVFADAKELHRMRYARYRGLGKIKMDRTYLFCVHEFKENGKQAV